MKKYIIPIAFFLIVFNSLLISQWEQASGPYGGVAHNFTASPEYLFAGGYGVFRSSDNGLHWENKSTGLWYPDVTAMTYSDGRLFAGVWYGYGNGMGYLFYSDDQGENWNQLNTVLLDSDNITGFLKDGNKLYFGTGRNGVYVSTDNGSSWTKSSNTGISGSIVGLASAGGYIFVITTDGMVYRSINDGNNWTALMNPSGYASATGFSCANEILYSTHEIDYFSGSAYRSTDYGMSWQHLSVFPAYVRTVSAYSGNVYIGTDKGIYRSSDSGLTWSDALLEGAIVLKIYCDASTLLAGTDYTGLFTSADYGNSWRQTGVSNTTSIQALNVRDDTVICGNDGQYGVFVSKNNADSFTGYHNMQLNYVHDLLTAGGVEYAACNQGVFSSNDQGLSWSAMGLPQMDVLCLLYHNNALLTGGENGVHRTTDNGVTWHQISIGLPQEYIWSLAAVSNKLYAAATNGVYVSTDNGASWLLSGMESFAVRTLTVLDNTLFGATEYGIYSVEASASEWSLAALDGYWVTFLTEYSGHLFAGVLEGGIPDLLRSDDNGQTWYSVGGGLQGQFFFTQLAFNANIAFLGTWNNGLWRRPAIEVLTGVKECIISNPEDYILSQNYPNPFNPSTNIGFTLPEAAPVKLMVINTLGETVEVLADEYLTAGSYEYQFNAAGLPSGIYFYRIETGTFSKVKKMLLLK